MAVSDVADGVKVVVAINPVKVNVRRSSGDLRIPYSPRVDLMLRRSCLIFVCAPFVLGYIHIGSTATMLAVV